MFKHALTHFLIKSFICLFVVPLNAYPSWCQAEQASKTQVKTQNGLPLYYWQQDKFVNFGDYISLKVVERIVGEPVRIYKFYPFEAGRKLLAIGSLLYFARNHDVLWGCGCNAKYLSREDYKFTQLDIRALRGPLTREFLKDKFNIDAPEIYGDPALLIPYLFPEFKRKKKPKYDYIVIPHYKEQSLFPKQQNNHAVYPTEPWAIVIQKIVNSAFVISSSLHGIVVAEAYGIPARMLRVTEDEPLFKYQDYYYGTNRYDFQYATSVEEALQMGGEKPFECDLERLYKAFPFECWPHAKFPNIRFPKKETAA